MNMIQHDREGFIELISNSDLIVFVRTLSRMMMASKQIMFAGNGGSYGNATHMAGDMLINTKLDADIIAIGDNLVSFSALSNDYSYEEAMAKEYSRRVRAANSVLVLLSTSGKSKNIVRLSEAAYPMSTVALITGKDPSPHLKHHFGLKLDSGDAGLIESAYDLIGHLLIKEINRCQL